MSHCRRLKMDYHHKNLQNPYYCFRSKNKSNQLWRRCRSIGILVGIVLIFLLWALYSSKWFLITKITITGNSRTSSSTIENIVREQMLENRVWFWRQSNLWLFNSSELKSNLNNKFNLANIDVKKRLFHNLKVTVTERNYAFILQDGDDYYYLDPAGYVVDQMTDIQPIAPVASNISPTTTAGLNLTSSTITMLTTTTPTILNPDYPLIINQGAAQIIDKKIIFNDNNNNYLAVISQINAELKQKSIEGLVAKDYLMGKEFNVLRVELTNNLTLLFNTQSDMNRSLNNLWVLKRELGPNFNKIKQKIDLRYGAKVYYE